MRCAICKKDGDEVELFEGIYNSEMVMVCEACAETESIPLIRKPTKVQIDQSKKQYSVRERMERMSGMRDTTPLSDDQAIVQGNLARLKMPDPKQTHPDVHSNYYWEVNMGRRRKKITVEQMAAQTGISADLLEDIEKGQIPENFEEVFPKLEGFLGVKLLKHHKPKVTMHRRHRDKEKEILDSVQRKIDGEDVDEHGSRENEQGLTEQGSGEKEKSDEERIIDDVKKKMESGKIDFSKRDSLKDITVSDLVDRKKRREAQKKRFDKRSKEESMMGDDIDLEAE